MGAEDLHSHFICRPKHEKKGGKRQSKLSELDGTVIVDFSTSMYRFIKGPNASAVIDVDDDFVRVFGSGII
jgi:hypothetical protein